MFLLRLFEQFCILFIQASEQSKGHSTMLASNVESPFIFFLFSFFEFRFVAETEFRCRGERVPCRCEETEIGAIGRILQTFEEGTECSRQVGVPIGLCAFVEKHHWNRQIQRLCTETSWRNAASCPQSKWRNRWQLKRIIWPIFRLCELQKNRSSWLAATSFAASFLAISKSETRTKRK